MLLNNNIYPFYRNDTQLASVMYPIIPPSGNPCLCVTSSISAYWEDACNIVTENSAIWNSGSDSAYLWNETFGNLSSNSANWNDVVSSWNTTSALFLQMVYTNDTLSGSGTSTSPLGFSAKTTEAIFGDTGLSGRIEEVYDTIVDYVQELIDLSAKVINTWCNENNWNNTYLTVSVNSANWGSGGGISGNYLSANVLNNLSGNWESVYSTVNINSAIWNIIGISGNYLSANALNNLSGNWQNTYNDVKNNSANWNIDSKYNFETEALNENLIFGVSAKDNGDNTSAIKFRLNISGYVNDVVNSKLTNVYVYKGSSTIEDLPISAIGGSVYNILNSGIINSGTSYAELINSGDNVAWVANDSYWDKLASTVIIPGYNISGDSWINTNKSTIVDNIYTFDVSASDKFINSSNNWNEVYNDININSAIWNNKITSANIVDKNSWYLDTEYGDDSNVGKSRYFPMKTVSALVNAVQASDNDEENLVILARSSNVNFNGYEWTNNKLPFYNITCESILTQCTYVGTQFNSFIKIDGGRHKFEGLTLSAINININADQVEFDGCTINKNYGAWTTTINCETLTSNGLFVYGFSNITTQKLAGNFLNLLGTAKLYANQVKMDDGTGMIIGDSTADTNTNYISLEFNEWATAGYVGYPISKHNYIDMKIHQDMYNSYTDILHIGTTSGGYVKAILTVKSAGSSELIHEDSQLGTNEYKVIQEINYLNTITEDKTIRAANTFLAAPNNTSGMASFRPIFEKDLPSANVLNWNTTYLNVNSNSANWNEVSAKQKIGNYLSANTFDILSGNWNNTYNSVNSNSANWNYMTLDTGIISGIYGSSSAVPQITFDSKGRAINANNIDIWPYIQNQLTSSDIGLNSANWNNTYLNVSANSANFNSVYTTVNVNSATWGGGGGGSSTAIETMETMLIGGAVDSVSLIAGSTDQWSGMGTRFYPFGTVNLTSAAIMLTSFPQVVNGGSIIYGIYIYDKSTDILTRKAYSNIFTLPGTSSDISANLVNIDNAIFNIKDIYYACVFTNCNGCTLRGLAGSNLNFKPYITGQKTNLGILSAAPTTFTFESENSNNIYSRIFIN